MADCNSLEALMTSLASEIVALKSKVAILESKQNNYATKSELESAIDAVTRLLERVIDRLAKKFENALEAINSILRILLGRNSENLEGRVTNLEIRVNGLDGVTGSLQRAIQSLQGRFSRLESRVTDLVGSIADILRRLPALENIQGQILQDIRNIYNQLGRHQKSIDDINGQIRLLWAAIALLQAQIAGLIYALAQLLARLKSLPSIRIGLNGKQGEKGTDGSKGEKGEKGSKGEKGEKGEKGSKGEKGDAGRDGKGGSQGARGTDGRKGEKGEKGEDGKKGEDAKVEIINVTVTAFKSCKADGTGAQYENISVPCIKGLEAQIIKEFSELSKIQATQCNEKLAIASIPERWQVEIGADRPQLIVQFAEVDAKGNLGRSRFPLSIPHYNKPAEFKPVIPNYRKGNYMGILLLKDNSRITVNAYSIAECERVIKVLAQYVDQKMLTGHAPKVGQRGGEPVQDRVVKAVTASYFATGRRDMNPTWWKSL